MFMNSYTLILHFIKIYPFIKYIYMLHTYKYTNQKATSLDLPIDIIRLMFSSLRKSFLGESGTSSGTTPTSLTFIIYVQTASSLGSLSGISRQCIVTILLQLYFEFHNLKQAIRLRNQPHEGKREAWNSSTCLPSLNLTFSEL